MPRVLIVDDEPVVRRLLRELLAPLGCELAEADSLASARAAFAERPADVALVDKNLPDGSGLELVREWKQAQPGLEAIVITGYASIDSAIEAIEVGAFDYVLKPFADVHALPLKVRNALEKVRLRRLESAMRQTQKMEALGRLAGGVAHDFNNMLCVVLNCGYEALADVEAGRAGPETVAALRDILAAVDNATRLTRQLLAFSRVGSGRADVIDLNVAIRETRMLLRRVLGEEVNLVLALDEVAGRVRLARTHVEQVLVNLAVNARDAMPRNGTITIETIALGNRVCLQVTDTGCGMSAEIAARIFDPFFTTKDQGRGTGLGLATVHAIVSEAGGSIAVESRVGVGTTFRITLPATDEVIAMPPPSSGALPPSRGETVLVVEDDDSVRDVVTRLFTRAGYVVKSAHDGAEAMIKFGQLGGAVDLLVTDVIMPRLSGPELADCLRQKQPSLKTIFMSGHVSSVLDERGLRADDIALLHKPFGERELATLVQSVLRREVTRA